MVAVTADLRIIIAIPDGMAEVDPDQVASALAECEAFRDQLRARGVAPVPCPVVVAEVGGRKFPCTLGPAGHTATSHEYHKDQA